MDGLSGGCPYPDEVFPLQNPVDNRGFAHVGFACEGNFRQSVFGKIRRGSRRELKFSLVKPLAVPHC